MRNSLWKTKQPRVSIWVQLLIQKMCVSAEMFCLVTYLYKTESRGSGGTGSAKIMLILLTYLVIYDN